MKATPGRSSATADTSPLDPQPTGWPAPYADHVHSSWIGDLMMGLPIAMALISREGKIVVGNDALLATVGDDFRLGSRPESLVIREDADQLTKAVAKAIMSGENSEVHAALQNRPDEKQILNILATPPGLGVAAMLAMRDIREQLRLEAQVAAATRMQAVGQLAGGVAHDFNNILTAVLALTDQLLDRHRAGDSDHEYLDEIRRNAMRATALVEQLLAFARQQPQRQQVLDLVPLIDALRPLLSQLIGKAVDLHINGGPLRAAVRADPGQIEQVVVNLAVNARDAMAGTGTLTITLRDLPAEDVAAQGHRIIPRADHVVIDVADTGSGIPAAIAGKIFEPFFTTKPMGQGTGLGLSTVYGIVKQTGGYIFAKPSPGARGTMFSIYLPAVQRSVASIAPAPVPTAETLDFKSLAGLRLLLVEDDAAVRVILERGLKRYGPIITVAADAMIALEIFETGAEFDVLVSDIMMPGIDGVELASRTMRMRPGIGVVLMSGFAEAPLHRAADAQGVRFLSKPFALADLAVAVATANAERPPQFVDYSTDS